MSIHDENGTCPMCGHEEPKACSALGQLGNQLHHRCRYCGAQWSETIFEEENENGDG